MSKSNAFSLDNKTILITGASSGIGRQCAISCSEAGATLILLDRDAVGLDGTRKMLYGKGHESIIMDITQYDEIEQKIKDPILRLGGINGFIHSAGIEMTLPLKILNHQKLNDIYAVNTIAAIELSRILSKKKYIAEKAGFVFIASVMAIMGQKGKIAYCSSKGALTSAARAMALELADKNIRVNTVLPGMVMTEMSRQLMGSLSQEAKTNIENMHPMGLGDVEDVANACIYLISDASKWVTGSSMVVDGGYSAK